MPRRKTELHPGELYHVYNRGHDRSPIFFHRDHFFLFLRKLREFLLTESSGGKPGESRGVQLVCYCLMPNHYHFLVKVFDKSFPKRMQSFGQSYVNTINRTTGRIGTLFQGPFQAKHVDASDYLVHLSRYIHRNPLEAGLVQRPSEWEFSSYREYLGTRHGTLPSPEIVLREFPSREAYLNFVEGSQSFPEGFDGVLFDDRE